MPHLCMGIQRKRVKGYWVRQSSSPETEPDFYDMPVVGSSSSNPIPPAVRSSDQVTTCQNTQDLSIQLPFPAMTPLPMPPLSSSLPIDNEFMLKNLAFAAPPATLAFSTTNVHYRPESNPKEFLKVAPDLFDNCRPDLSKKQRPAHLCKSGDMSKQLLDPLSDLPLNEREQEDLAAFLSDVDLDSDQGCDDDDVYRNEGELGRIYATNLRQISII